MKLQLNTQEECLLHFEKLRWGKKIVCPYCFSANTHRAKSEPGRHFCYTCVKSFSVLVGTVFEDTRLPLPIWITIIKKMLKSNSIIPAKSLSADFGITVKTAWLTAMKIRCAMIDKDTSLQGLLNMNNYFAVKATKKSKVKKLTGELTPVHLTGLLKQYIKYPGHNKSTSLRSSATMNKSIQQLSPTYTAHNKIGKNQGLQDNYRVFIKNGIFNESKSLSAKYLPFYLLEYEYKFKRKGVKSIFPQFMKDLFSEPSKAINLSNALIRNQVACA